MNPEVIGHSQKRVKSTTSTKINMGSKNIFYQFGISSTRDSQIEYY